MVDRGGGGGVWEGVSEILNVHVLLLKSFLTQWRQNDG